MRTKTLLLSAAVLAAGLAASTAQSVYSVNAVGYVNTTLLNGYNLVANPLNGTNNTLSTILPNVPGGTTVYRWNNASQSFLQADTYFDGLGWLDSSFNPSTTSINPGEGFFLQNNTGTNVPVTFVGEVPQGNLTNRVGAIYGFYSSQVPQQATLPQLGFPGSEGMFFYTWNPTNQTYNQAYTYLAGSWFDGSFNQVDPVLQVAQGFLLNNPGAAVNWTRTFSVN